MSLRARSMPVDDPVDPLTVGSPDDIRWIAPDHSIVACDSAAAVDLGPTGEPGITQLRDLLASIDDDGSGPPPLAAAAIPFRPGAPARAVVPRVALRCGPAGQSWLTHVADDRHEAADPAAALARLLQPSPTRPAPTTFDIQPRIPPVEWMASVSAATEALKAGRAAKVVLARSVRVATDSPLDARALVGRLAEVHPSCTTFHLDGLVAASPELLVRRDGTRVRSHPLAGTTRRSGDPSADARLAAALMSSAKNRREHQLTIDRVHETLLPHCSYLDSEAEPSIVTTTNVAHLGTEVEGRLSTPAPSAIELALMLHPTPAVGGEPAAAALELIDELEPDDRGRYAGTAGWLDASGDGVWMVSIRCAELDDEGATVWAGNGIVADSDPELELAETRAKMSAMLSAIVRP